MAQWWCPVQEVGGGHVEQSAATQGLGVAHPLVLGADTHAGVPDWVQVIRMLSPVVLRLP